MRKILNSNCSTCKTFCLQNFYDENFCLQNNCYCCNNVLIPNCYFQNIFFDCFLCENLCRLRGFNYTYCVIMDHSKTICSCCLNNTDFFEHILTTTKMTTNVQDVTQIKPDQTYSKLKIHNPNEIEQKIYNYTYLNFINYSLFNKLYLI